MPKGKPKRDGSGGGTGNIGRGGCDPPTGGRKGQNKPPKKK